ncbi:hypothetical protein P3X46_019546 [Hevea brasiliensis]|uniref:C3H1-type domain-containing protein n=1 Tax=Hevea brasiliensis TaxID=3981 RepID=A0ABQ9LJ14_HEVBR|nr:hypothetical protein P3X46_019546 [Hevea brasiliensis]
MQHYELLCVDVSSSVLPLEREFIGKIIILKLLGLVVPLLFDALSCVGQFYPAAPELLEGFMDYVDGRSQIPLPICFIGDYGIGSPKVLSVASKSSANLRFKVDGLKICGNLFWLRSSGKFTLQELKLQLIELCIILLIKVSNIDVVHVTRFFGFTMTTAKISMKPSNTKLSANTFRPGDCVSDSQHWRYDVSQKRQKTGAANGDKLCFKYIYSQYSRGACIDFFTKGKCERGPDCNFYPSLESHLIITMGENYYLPCLYPKNVDMNLLDSGSLKLFCKNRGKEAILFEWISKHGTRAKLQSIIILGRKWLRTQFDRNYNFFCVELPDGNKLSYLVEENMRFPVQFGRAVLAGLLNVPERADWRTCELSKEDETKMVEEFKKNFEGLDPVRIMTQNLNGIWREIFSIFNRMEKYFL